MESGVALLPCTDPFSLTLAPRKIQPGRLFSASRLAATSPQSTPSFLAIPGQLTRLQIQGPFSLFHRRQLATMGFSLANEQGLPALEEWLKTRSYIDGYVPSQADVAVSKAITYNVNAAKYPHVSRWRRHIKSFEDEFSILSGDVSKPHTAYGPAASAAAEADDDEDVDLFGSDDEEEDAEAAKIREQRLAEYGQQLEPSPTWPI
jgi:Eukaryotic elongation factor 1 beta central acidic region